MQALVAGDILVSARRSSPASELPVDIHDVVEELYQWFEARSRRASAYGPHFADLWRWASAGVRGGKMLRPRLLLGVFDALRADGGAGAPRGSATRIAAGIELLHYAFLLHDDVIDGDVMRRGEPNLVGAVLRERDTGGPAQTDAAVLHWARTNAMLMGDLLLADAHQLFAREGLPTSMRERLWDLLDHAITESVAGEQLDVGLSDGAVESDLDTVLGMSRLKTATYTFELPLRAAAILAAGSPRTEQALGAIGRHLGVAFQLQDDLLSTFGRDEEHGKDAFSDLREGKETVIVAYARTTSAWPGIRLLFGNGSLEEHDARLIRDLLVDCGAEQFVRSLIADRLIAAAELIASPQSELTDELTQLLEQFMDSMEERRS